jgi:transposase
VLERDGVEAAHEGRSIGISPTEKLMASAFFGRTSLAIVLRGLLQDRSEGRLIRTAVTIKSWIAQTPSVDEVRPARCAGCGAASQPVGGRLVVHGQGLLQRQLRGVLEADAEPGMVVVEVRRYECQRCGAVMTVVPAGMLARRQYSASSIALALHLWVALGQPDRVVRERICAWQIHGRSHRGWAQLYRWARSAAHVFALPRLTSSVDDVMRVLTTLRALASVSLSTAPIAVQIFEGATHTR